MQSHLSADFPAPEIRATLFFLVQERGIPSQENLCHFYKKRFMPCFSDKTKTKNKKRKRLQRTLLVSVDSQFSCIQFKVIFVPK